MNDIQVFVEEESLDVTKLVQKIQLDSHGAIDLFIGTVRNHHQGQKVTGITYDAHAPMAKRVFKEICEESLRLWPETRYIVSHFKGDLLVGGISIIIAVSSPHRAESFDACRYVIEEIKKRAPIWKQEHYLNGKSIWLPGHSLNNGHGDTQSCQVRRYGGMHD